MVPVTMGTLGESLAEFRVKVIGSLGSVNETYKGADYGGCVAALHSLEVAVEELDKHLRRSKNQLPAGSQRETVLEAAQQMVQQVSATRTVARYVVARPDGAQVEQLKLSIIEFAKLVQVLFSTANGLALSPSSSGTTTPTMSPAGTPTPGGLTRTSSATSIGSSWTPSSGAFGEDSEAKMISAISNSPEQSAAYVYMANQFNDYYTVVYDCTVQLARAIERDRRDDYALLVNCITDTADEIVQEVQAIDLSGSATTQSLKTTVEKQASQIESQMTEFVHAMRIASGIWAPDDARANFSIALISLVQSIKEAISYALNAFLFRAYVDSQTRQRSFSANTPRTVNSAMDQLSKMSVDSVFPVVAPVQRKASQAGLAPSESSPPPPPAQDEYVPAPVFSAAEMTAAAAASAKFAAGPTPSRASPAPSSPVVQFATPPLHMTTPGSTPAGTLDRRVSLPMVVPNTSMIPHAFSSASTSVGSEPTQAERSSAALATAQPQPQPQRAIGKAASEEGPMTAKPSSPATLTRTTSVSAVVSGTDGRRPSVVTPDTLPAATSPSPSKLTSFLQPANTPNQDSLSLESEPLLSSDFDSDARTTGRRGSVAAMPQRRNTLARSASGINRARAKLKMTLGLDQSPTSTLKRDSEHRSSTTNVALTPADMEAFKAAEAEQDSMLKELEDEFMKASDLTFRADDGAVKTGSLVRLVERLTWHRTTDPVYSLAFLLTYESFTNGVALLDALQARYHIQIPESVEALGVDAPKRVCFIEKVVDPVRLRVFNTVKTWVSKHYQDFRDDPQLALRLDNFIDQLADSADDETRKSGMFAEQLRKLRTRRSREPDELAAEVTPDRSVNAKLSFRLTADLDLLDVPELEFAQQLTAWESGLYRRIRGKELLNQSWNNWKKHGESAKTNVNHLIDVFNNISNLISSEIARGTSEKRRAAAIRHFIGVAESLRTLQNFDALMAVIAALNGSAIRRLKKSWTLVSEKRMAKFEELQSQVSQESNYKALRGLLTTLNPPLIPYVGMYLTDLTFIEDGNKDNLEGLINFDKRRKVANVIRDIQQYQMQALYPLQAFPDFITLLQTRMKKNFTEDQLYEQSLIAEPRA